MTIYGAELAAGVKLFGIAELAAGYQYLGYDAAEQLEYRPAHKAVFSLSAGPFPRVPVTLTARLMIQGPQQFIDPNTGAWNTLTSYAYADLSLAWTPIKQLQLLLRVANPGDTLYQPKYGYPAAGRMFFVSLKGSL